MLQACDFARLIAHVCGGLLQECDALQKITVIIVLIGRNFNWGDVRRWRGIQVKVGSYGRMAESFPCVQVSFRMAQLCQRLHVCTYTCLHTASHDSRLDHLSAFADPTRMNVLTKVGKLTCKTAKKVSKKRSFKIRRVKIFRSPGRRRRKAVVSRRRRKAIVSRRRYDTICTDTRLLLWVTKVTCRRAAKRRSSRRRRSRRSKGQRVEGKEQQVQRRGKYRYRLALANSSVRQAVLILYAPAAVIVDARALAVATLRAARSPRPGPTATSSGARGAAGPAGAAVIRFFMHASTCTHAPCVWCTQAVVWIEMYTWKSCVHPC